MYTIHDKEPIPFALVQPHQQVKPFGRPATAKAPRAQPLNLKVDDIPGTRTKQHCFGTSPRLTNPVDPQYQWPRHQQPDAPAPKFIRNTLDTSDIPGSQTRIPNPPKQQEHSIQLDCSDIEGAKPQWQPDWRIAASARHAAYRPASAPTQLSHSRAVRPINYVHDIAGSSPWHASTKDAHRFKIEAAELAHADEAAARQLLQSRLSPVSTAAVTALCRQLASFDRECCGRISSSEFAEALQSSKLGLSNAEVLRVTNGLSDCHGLLSYRPVANMLHQHGCKQRQSTDAGASASPQGATSASNTRPPLSPQRSMLHYNVGNRAKQHAHQPYINRPLYAASVPDAAVPSEDGCQKQQKEKSGQSPVEQRTEPQQQQKEQQQQQPQPQQRQSGQQSRVTSAQCDQSQTQLYSPAAASAKMRKASDFAVRVRPPAARAPYWFSKGMVGDMSKPHKWIPSEDNSTIGNPKPAVHYVRPWSAGVPQQAKRAMEAQHHQQQLLQSPQQLPSSFQRPQTARPAAASLIASESASARRQRTALLEDMMTIRGL